MLFTILTPIPEFFRRNCLLKLAHDRLTRSLIAGSTSERPTNQPEPAKKDWETPSLSAKACL
jgi:hypothetical protein